MRSQANSLTCNKTSFPGASTYSTTAPKSNILITFTSYALPTTGLNSIDSMRAITFSIPAGSVPNISIIPSSVTASSVITIVVPVSFCNS